MSVNVIAESSCLTWFYCNHSMFYLWPLKDREKQSKNMMDCTLNKKSLKDWKEEIQRDLEEAESKAVETYSNTKVIIARSLIDNWDNIRKQVCLFQELAMYR